MNSITQENEYLNAIRSDLSRIENTILIVFLILIIVNIINLLFNSVMIAKQIVNCSKKRKAVSSVKNNTFSLKTYKPIE